MMRPTLSLFERCKQALEDIGLEAEEDLSAVDVSDDGTTRVHLTCSGGGHDDGDLIVQAAHVAIHMELVNHGALDIVINLTKPPEKVPCATIAEFIEAERQSVNDLATACARNFVRAALVAAVSAYPWRQKEQMLASVDFRCAKSVLYTLRGTPDPLMAGNVDEILPSLKGLIDEAAIKQLLQSVQCTLGRPARTILEVYETVYHCVHASTACSLMHIVYHKLFRHSA